jgi:ketosteroid isomerase-like protein
MSRATKTGAVLLALFLSTIAAGAQKTSQTADKLKKLLHEFLDAAGRNDRAGFHRFFADDLIYTRSAGVTITKADIMKDLSQPAKPDDPKTTYEADDITVHEYGNMAVVNFRLIQHLDKEGKRETNYFRNTGTFLRRNGRWQAVAWQATRVPAETDGAR